MKPTEVTFEVTKAEEGGYNARALGYGIFTQGEDWSDLKFMVRDAAACHFGEGGAAAVIRLQMVGRSQPEATS